MASTLAPTIAPDTVVTFQINPGTLLQFLETRAEGGPRLKCFEGSVTLVTPGMSHETKGSRLDHLILAVCLELHIKFTCLESTTWTLPFGAGDTGYEADKAYYVQSFGTTKEHHPPTWPSKSSSLTRRRQPCGPGRFGSSPRCGSSTYAGIGSRFTTWQSGTSRKAPIGPSPGAGRSPC